MSAENPWQRGGGGIVALTVLRHCIRRRSILSEYRTISSGTRTLCSMLGAVQEGTAAVEGAAGEDDATFITRAPSVPVKNRLHFSAPIDVQLPQYLLHGQSGGPSGRPRRAPPRSPSAGCHVATEVPPRSPSAGCHVATGAPPLPPSASCHVATDNRSHTALAVLRLPRGNRSPAAPARTAVAPAHVGLGVRVERLEPLEARVRRRRTASVRSAGPGAPATGPPLRAPWSRISATRPATRPSGEIWTSRTVRSSSMPKINHYCASNASLGGDSRQIHAGIAHRMVGAIRGCSVTAHRASSRSPNRLTSPSDRDTYESRVGA